MMDPEQIERLRPKAFGVAYRMLGSVSEAEDVVQEGLLRLHRATESGTQVESPEAFLVTTVTRLAIDELRSARARREVYVGDASVPLAERGSGHSRGGTLSTSRSQACNQASLSRRLKASTPRR